MDNLHIVEFDKYCMKCQYYKLDENDDPCYECLKVGARENSRKPERYSPRVSKKRIHKKVR